MIGIVLERCLALKKKKNYGKQMLMQVGKVSQIGDDGSSQVCVIDTHMVISDSWRG